jgi:Bacterial extracellular solute-binding proteins, family 3
VAVVTVPVSVPITWIPVSVAVTVMRTPVSVAAVAADVDINPQCYRADAPPFSYQDESSNADGYAVELCKVVAEQVKSDLGLSRAVEWVPVTVEDQFKAEQENKVDLLCGAAETLTSRKDVDFSVPIFPGGIRALLRAAPLGLKEVLSGRPPSAPLWRGYPAQVLETQVFSVVVGAVSWIRFVFFYCSMGALLKCNAPPIRELHKCGT